MGKKVSYKTAGVDICKADAVKKQMAESLQTNNPLVLNKLGAFSSLCDGRFPGYRHPVLVCKTEEPGSKQLIAFQHGYSESICYDLINHLVNDVSVMGAKPMFVQDLIVCGKLEKDIVNGLVRNITKACEAQGCSLTGGETSEQPGVLDAGTYILGASCIGVVEKDKIIDGSAIRPGDTILAVESSGLHTNGYTLVRTLIKQNPNVLGDRIGTKTFLDVIMEPHRCYFNVLRSLFEHPGLHGMAHITGGGIPGNLNRILPERLDATIDASAIKILPVFSFIREKSGNDDRDMMRTFNLGVGLVLVVDPKASDAIINSLKEQGLLCYPIGAIVEGGSQNVKMEGNINW